MIFSKIAATVAFCAGASMAIKSNRSPFIAYICPPGPSNKPFAYREAAAIRAQQTDCGYIANDNRGRHGVLVNQCPQSLPDTPECEWYAFDQDHDVRGNGAPFVFYATKDTDRFDATAVRCKQAGCKWIARSTKVKKAGTMGILCNQCQRSPDNTPGADAYGFSNNPPPRDSPPRNPPAVVKQVTSTVTRYAREGNQFKTIYIVHVNGKPVSSSTVVAVAAQPSVVTRIINVGGRKAQTLYIKYINGRPDSTRTVFVNQPAVETSVVTKYIKQGGETKTIHIIVKEGTTKTITYTKGPKETGNGGDGDGDGDDGDNNAGGKDGGDDGDNNTGGKDGGDDNGNDNKGY
ncbi:hypothetical protein TWF506_007601 [Arthrobotrys conoides]|uniref:Uncharacterized protein n=1 Tax=Arthrobotrys conoides TaxID=74498 RepID=A0AAN8NRJ1_9PEZI